MSIGACQYRLTPDASGSAKGWLLRDLQPRVSCTRIGRSTAQPAVSRCTASFEVGAQFLPW
jgi:hypothetical protein